MGQLFSSCVNKLRETGYISKLDSQDNLTKIIDRLPYSLRVTWRGTKVVTEALSTKYIADIMKTFSSADEHVNVNYLKLENEQVMLPRMPKGHNLVVHLSLRMLFAAIAVLC